MYNNDVGKESAQNFEANRRPKGRHPLFCFISFIGIYYPLTDIVIVHIVCNPSAHPSAHSSVHS